MEKIKYVAEGLKEIEEFIKYSDNVTYDDLVEHVDRKLAELKEYANENNIPFLANTYNLIAANTEEESYSEESSSEEEYYEESEVDDDEKDEK